LILTGSSALDLKRGGERLPGRRGICAHENDLNILPLNFRVYIENLYGLKDLPSVSEANVKDLYNLCLIEPSIYYTYLQAFIGDITKAGKKGIIPERNCTHNFSKAPRTSGLAYNLKTKWYWFPPYRKGICRNT